MSAERPIPLPQEEMEAMREPLVPGERTLDDFPVGQEVVAYVMHYGYHELRRGTVAAHSEGGFVIISLENTQRGVPVGSNHGKGPYARLPKLSPKSPGLLLPEELETLGDSMEGASRWTAKGDTYKDSERARLARKISQYAGYDGPPLQKREPAIRERAKGVNKAGWPGD